MQVLNWEFLEERKEELINFPDWIPIIVRNSIFSYDELRERLEIVNNDKTLFEIEKKHGMKTKFLDQNISIEYDPGMLDLYMFTLAHPEFAPAINKTDKEKTAYRKAGLKIYKGLI